MNNPIDDLATDQPARVHPAWIITIHEQAHGLYCVAVTEMQTGRESHALIGMETAKTMTVEWLVKEFARTFSNGEA